MNNKNLGGLIMTTWSFLGKGSYNEVYRSKDGLSVLKIPIIKGDKTDAYDTPERAVRLWNEINAHIKPPAYVIRTDGGHKGWVCPFIEGVQASDEEISAAIIDIFNTTGRIVIDAPGHKNVIKMPTGQIVCVDIGLAVEFDNREKEYLVGGKPRRTSVTGIDAWTSNVEGHQRFLKACCDEYPMAAHTINVLMLIKYHRPDMFDASFLRGNGPLIFKLTGLYAYVGLDSFLTAFDRVAAGAETMVGPAPAAGGAGGGAAGTCVAAALGATHASAAADASACAVSSAATDGGGGIVTSKFFWAVAAKNGKPGRTASGETVARLSPTDLTMDAHASPPTPIAATGFFSRPAASPPTTEREKTATMAVES